MKHYLSLLFVNLTCVFMSFGQLRCPPVYGDNSLRKFHITIGGGITSLYGDIDKSNTAGWGTYGRLDYTIIRGLNIGGEGQIGSLEAVSNPPYDRREVKGNYFNLGLSMSAYPFDMSLGSNRRRSSFGERLARGFYLGVGGGFIYNFHRGHNFRDLNNLGTYGPPDSDDVLANPRFKQRTSSLLLPVLNGGFTIPFTNDSFRQKGYWSIVINGQFNFADNDDMDGYVPLKADGTRLGKENDYYGFYSLGVRYSL